MKILDIGVIAGLGLLELYMDNEMNNGLMWVLISVRDLPNKIGPIKIRGVGVHPT